MSPERILQKWRKLVPRDGASCEDAVAVMRHLGMDVMRRKSGHWTGKHESLVGSEYFPHGVITLNCHAFGRQGNAHPAAIRDIVRAADLIEGQEE